MGKSFDPIGVARGMRDAKLCNSTPRPIASMSFQLVIPWRVALQQSRRCTSREPLCSKEPLLAIKNQRTVNSV